MRSNWGTRQMSNRSEYVSYQAIPRADAQPMTICDKAYSKAFSTFMLDCLMNASSVSVFFDDTLHADLFEST